jgi:hypothetical protein
MNRSHRVRAAAALIALALCPAAAPAQALPGLETLRLGTGASFETYQFLDPAIVGVSRLSLATVPFGARVRPLERLQLQVGGAYAHGSLRRTDGSDATLSGLTDTEIRASYTLGRDLVVLSAAYLAPTGRATHTLDEAEVAGTIASDLLPFRISQWGSGGGMALGTSVAVPVAGFGVGAGIGYTVAQEFEALDVPEERWAYLPGNELRLRLGVDRTLGSTGMAALLVNLQRYDEDRIQGENLLQPGNRYDVTGYYTFAVGAVASAVTYLGVAHRDQGTFAAQIPGIPAQDLVFAGAGARVPLGGTVFVPAVEGRLFRRSDGFNQGHLAGLGASLEWPVGSVVLVPTVRSRFGTVLLWEGEEASFRGGEFGVSVRMGAGR